jgi:hypothetical protein
MRRCLGTAPTLKFSIGASAQPSGWVIDWRQAKAVKDGDYIAFPSFFKMNPGI